MAREIEEVLRDVVDPELGINIVDLGLVYEAKLDEEKATVRMTMTSPSCPMHEELKDLVERMLRMWYPLLKKVTVDIVWEPRWSPDRMSKEAKKRLGWTS